MRMGFIVNPIAGMGGKVGLKGTDGVLERAIERGAQPIAPARAIEFLRRLRENAGNLQVEILSCPGVMGANEADTAGMPVKVLNMKIRKETSAKDTESAVRLLLVEKVDLIVFVGGDGTAKDIMDAMQGNEKTPVLGVPSGVKMYSGIFAVSPSDAVKAVIAFVRGRANLINVEIVDADENASRNDVFSIKLHGYLKGLSVPMRIQGCKQVSPETTDEKKNQNAIARFMIEQMPSEGTFLLGPGTTVGQISELLGVKKTVLGVDIYEKGKVKLDVNEKTILERIKDWKNTWLIVSPIGRQGMLLGRGNQQVSPEIIRHLGKEHIIIVATRSKLESIEGRTLRVDTGDPEIDEMLRGPIMIITNRKESVLAQIQ